MADTILDKPKPSETVSANQYITGIHAPMKDEKTIEDLPVIGEIPAVLDGRYLRMGPNPMSPDPAKHHWFAGDGMVHGLRIQDGRALWYRNRWIRSEAVTAALGEARKEGPRRLFDTVNTNVVGLLGLTLGSVEAGSTPIEIGATLETLRYTDFGGGLHGGLSPHPHVDPPDRRDARHMLRFRSAGRGPLCGPDDAGPSAARA